MGFQKKHPNIKHVIYDSVSSSEALADYDFSKAEVIVSVGADFIGDWQGGGFEGSYAKSRIPKKGKMSRHYQFESNMSLSGANADVRIPIIPSLQVKVLKALVSD